ncbi:MAG: molybdenum cofactor guanylyltransferase [Betaproteobacteria bacterium]|nr:molybdenum cofactor guanylyltransferase [Betaproteobacteria bacterium]
MIPSAAITGLVLAGGLGRRMSADGQGTDKGLMRFRGRPLAQHAIDRLRPQVGRLLINANRHAEIYRGFGAEVVADALPDFAGPLAGLLGGMAAASTPWVVMVPCDSPFLPEDLVARLAEAARAQNAPVAVARSAGREQPVFLLAATHLREGLARYLVSGGRRIDAWYRPLPAAVVDFADEKAFRNINTLAELQALE